MCNIAPPLFFDQLEIGGTGMFRNLMVGGLSLAMLAVLQGCGAGGPSEKDTNPNPSLESNKEGPPKRGGAMPGTNPKGVKVDSGQGDKK